MAIDNPSRFDSPQIPREKSPERLQAQAEIFADKDAKNHSDDQAKLLSYSAELSQIKDLDNLPPDLPAELVGLVQRNKDSYLSFLRQEKRLETSFVEENIQVYQARFRPVIAELKLRIAAGDFKVLPEYLGSGSNGKAFRIEVDGQEYAAKFSQSITQSNYEIKPLLRARGIAHVAQLGSYSFDDGVVIMNLLPGTDVTQLAPEIAPEYSDKDITQLIDTVCELAAKGIMIDPKPSNFMYDEEQGFSILDYHLQNRGGYRLPEQIMSLGRVLAARKFKPLDYKSPNYEEEARAQQVEYYKIFLPTMIRFLSILKEEYPAILSDWQRQHDEDKKQPNLTVYEPIRRDYVPDSPELGVYLKKLEEIGF